MRGGFAVLCMVGVGCGFSGASGDGSIDASATDVPDDGNDTPFDAPGELPDAEVLDAPPFQLSRCDQDARYEAVIGAPSRYRWGTGNGRAWDAIRDCANDLPGLTHAVVLETDGEHAAIELAMIAETGDRFWVGGMQRLGATAPAASWIWVTGAAWRDAWQLGEPTDWNPEDQEVDGEEHGHEQFVRLDEFGPGYVDTPGDFTAYTLCECDGQPMTAEAMELLDTLSP